jgi:hypothetical protein
VERPGVFNFLRIEPASELTPAFEHRLYELYFEMRRSQMCTPRAAEALAGLWSKEGTVEAVLRRFRALLGTSRVRIIPFVATWEPNPAPFVLGQSVLGCSVPGSGLLGARVPSVLHAVRVEAKLPFAQIVAFKKRGVPGLRGGPCLRIGGVRVELCLESVDEEVGSELGYGFRLGQRVRCAFF